MSCLCYYAGMNKERKIQVDQSKAPEYRVKINHRREVLKAVAKDAVIVAAATATAAGIYVGGFNNGVATEQENSIPKLSGETVTVNQGENLWGIAEEISPNQDPRDVVDELLRANPGVSPDSIEPGQVLQIPLDIAKRMENPEK
jgi:LysM repeat protein